jgi:hypothetical protein
MAIEWVVGDFKEERFWAVLFKIFVCGNPFPDRIISRNPNPVLELAI